MRGGRKMEAVKKLLRDESGQGMVEYALIIALIAVVAVAAITILGGRISTMFTNVSNDLPS
jgi:pilus assembly protein Flp/PilA